MQKTLSIILSILLVIATSCQKVKYQNGYYCNLYNKIIIIQDDTINLADIGQNLYYIGRSQTRIKIADFMFSCHLPISSKKECLVTQISAARFELSSEDSCANASKAVGLYQYVDLKNYDWDSLYIMFRATPEADQRIFKSDLKKMATIESHGLDNEIKLIITGLCDNHFRNRSSMPNFDLDIFYAGRIVKRIEVDNIPYYLTYLDALAYNKIPNIME